MKICLSAIRIAEVVCRALCEDRGGAVLVRQLRQIHWANVNPCKRSDCGVEKGAVSLKCPHDLILSITLTRET